MPTTIDVPAWIDQRRLSRTQILVLVLCAATAILDGFDAQVIGYVAPALADTLKVARPALSAVFALGTTGLMLGCLFVAPLADWLGRRTVIIGSVVFFALMSLATAHAESLTSLMVLRFLTGLGRGGSMPNIIALTSEYFPARRRATMTMTMFTGFPLGASLGGFLAAHLIPLYGWPSIFIVGGALPLVLAALLALRLPESIRFLVARGDAGHRVEAVLRRIDPAASFPADAVFVSHEPRTTGLTVRHLFREGRAFGTIAIWVMYFMSLLDIYLLSSWLPTVLKDAGLSLALSVVATAMLQVGGVVASLSLGRVVDRVGFLSVMLPTYLCAGLAIALIGAVGSSPALLMAATFLAGAGVIGGQTTLNVLTAVYYPTAMRSTGIGWGLGIGRIGSIVGPILGGFMLHLDWSHDTIFASAALPAFIAALAVFAMSRTDPHRIGRRALAEAAPPAE